MRDPSTEEWLATENVSWTYEADFDLALIDRKASTANQARLEPLDEDVVERYAVAVKNGDVFPPLLVWQRPRSAPILLGGNHRTHAFDKAGKTTHDAYVVFCDQDQAIPLMYGDNRRHGLPPSTDERCAQAIHLIEARQYTPDRAAQTVGITYTRLVLGRAVANSERRARALQIAKFDKVPKSIRARLDAIPTDTVFAEAATLVVTAAMNQEAVFSLVTRLNEAGDEFAALALLDKERNLWRGQNRADSGNVKMAATDRNRAMRAVNELSRCTPREVADACIDGEQARLLAQTLLSGRRQLDDMVDALRARWP